MSHAFSQSNILTGFQKADIIPFNPEVFSDDDFLSSAVTDRDLPQEQTLTSAPMRLETQLVFSAELEESLESLNAGPSIQNIQDSAFFCSYGINTEKYS
ncbi:hypothetical protein Zmor_013930 [Zophobas morio]|uniref:Uncharacterized protein n=1 Tax=Zophobas morio TaxID=2755281 RepID=A0AA38IBD0_9CUCU|nr:hypothetical protein Zmor_013930 [Zophobas morio]